MRGPYCLGFIVFVFLSPGCGEPQSKAEILPVEYLTVITDTGEKAQIPAGRLIDPDTGEPAAQSVLAIDRHTGKETWIPVNDLLSGPPAVARYIPVTQKQSVSNQ